MAKFIYPKDSVEPIIILQLPSGTITLERGDSVEIPDKEVPLIDGYLIPAKKKPSASEEE